MCGPPPDQSAAVGVPAAGGAYLLKEAVRRWLTTPTVCTKSPASREHSDEECPDPHMVSHKVPSSSQEWHWQLAASGTLLGFSSRSCLCLYWR